MNEDLLNQGVILTALGQSLIENAGISGTSIQLQKFSIGDGGVGEFNPSYDDLKALTAIPGEWDKRNLVDVYDNPDGAGYIAEGLVPHDIGEGKFCRIAGYWTADNKLFAVHLIPEWQKPVNSGNILIELPLKAYIGVSGQANITLVIDPSLVQATREYVDRKSLNVYVTANQDAVTVGNKLHIFTAPADLQIPLGKGTSFDFIVDNSVVLSDVNKCRLLAPTAKKIIMDGIEYTSIDIQVKNIRHTVYIDKNGNWKL